MNETLFSIFPSATFSPFSELSKKEIPCVYALIIINVCVARVQHNTLLTSSTRIPPIEMYRFPSVAMRGADNFPGKSVHRRVGDVKGKFSVRIQREVTFRSDQVLSESVCDRTGKSGYQKNILNGGP